MCMKPEPTDAWSDLCADIIEETREEQTDQVYSDQISTPRNWQRVVPQPGTLPRSASLEKGEQSVPGHQAR